MTTTSKSDSKSEFLDFWKNLPGTTQATLLDKLEQKVSEDADLWTDGKEPVSFDKFCVELDKCALFPRQRRAFEQAGWLSPRTFTLKEVAPAQELVLCWGK